jgi:hypothetical protein
LNGLLCVVFILQVIEDLLDHHRGFEARDHFDVATALSASFNINIENAFEALRPRHRCPAFKWCALIRFAAIFGFVSFIVFARCHQCTMLTVRRKDTVITG